MRPLYALALVVALAGCAAPPAALPPPGPDPAILAARQARADSLAAVAETRAAEARAESERLAAAQAARAARQSGIRTASQGSVPLTLTQPATLRESPSIAAPVVADLPAGSTLTVHSHDGRYWGAETTDGEWGYVSADVMPRDEDARVRVTTGRDVAAERERARVAEETRVREAARAREARRATAPPARASGGSSGRARSTGPTTQRVATQCTGTTQLGARCRRMTTSRNGRCYQHGG